MPEQPDRLNHMNENTIHPAVEDHVRWVEQALERGMEHGWSALQQAVKDLDDEQARGLLFVALTALMLDRQKAKKIVENWRTAPFN
jgi:hypothetical protein